MGINKDDIVRFLTGSSIYRVTKTSEAQDENKVYEITHTDGRIFKLKEYSIERLIKLDISTEAFEKLPPKKIDYPDWTGVNPHRRVEDLDGEKWFEVIGYEDSYRFSNKGRVKSLNSCGLRDNHLILSEWGSYKNGHVPTVKLYKNGQPNHFNLEEIALISLPINEYKTLKERWENEHAEYVKNIEELKNHKTIMYNDLIKDASVKKLTQGIIYQREVKCNSCIYVLYLYLKENNFRYSLEKTTLVREDDTNSPYYGSIVKKIISNYGGHTINEFSLIILYSQILDAGERDDSFLFLCYKIESHQFRDKEYTTEDIENIKHLIKTNKIYNSGKLNYSSAWYVLSTLYFRNKNYNESLSLLNKALESNIYTFNLSNLYFLRGQINLNLGNLLQAVDDYNKVLSIGDGKGSKHLFATLGRCNYKLGEYNEAVKNFSQALHFKEDKSFYLAIGNSFFKMQKYEQAIYYYSKTVVIDNSIYLAYYNRAVSYLKLNMLENAKKDLEIASNNGFKKATDLLKKYESKY